MTVPVAQRATSLRLVRSDGREMSFGGSWSGEWAVEWEGTSDLVTLPVSIETSANVLGDGSRLVSKRVGECDRTASVIYVGRRDPQSVRDEALSFFNPKHSFQLHVTHLGRTRWCEGELSDVECRLTPGRYPCRVTFTLLCLDPYMRSEDGNEAEFGDAKPMLGWPYVSHVREVGPSGERYPVGNPVGTLVYDGLNTVYNSGDVPTYYRVRIRAAGGDLVNPKVTKDGRFVRLLTTLKHDDVAEVDFESSPPKVTVNGRNAINLCSRDSNFTGMRMQVGANVFGFEIDNPGNRAFAHVQVLFTRKYLGV